MVPLLIPVTFPVLPVWRWVTCCPYLGFLPMLLLVLFGFAQVDVHVQAETFEQFHAGVPGGVGGVAGFDAADHLGADPCAFF